MTATIKAAGLSIEVNGNALDPDDFTRVEEVSIVDEVNTPGMFDIRYNISNFRTGDWQGTEGKPFNLGDEVKISMGFDTRKNFTGKVTSIEPSFNPAGPAMHVRGYDELFKLKFGTRVRVFRDLPDSLIVELVALEQGIIVIPEPLTVIQDYVFQNNISDFDFILERARANFFDIVFHDGKLYFFPSLLMQIIEDLEGSTPELEYKFGFDTFEGRLTSQALGSAVIVQGYDTINASPIFGIYGDNLEETLVAGLMAELKAGAQLALQALMSPGTTSMLLGTLADATASLLLAEGEAAVISALLTEGKSMTNIAAKFLNTNPIYITDQNVESQLEAEALAVAKYQELLQPYIEGRGDGIGNPEIRAGIYIKLTGLGNNFSGPFYVTSSTHSYDFEKGYRTSFNVKRKWYDTIL